MNTHPLKLPTATSDARVRTLVVDDSPFMLKILTQILREAGNFDLVGAAADGCQALRYVSMLSLGLVLIDVHMPRLNGIQATRYIKQREHPPVVIITTSDNSAVAKATAEQAGADAFVTKEGNLRQQLMGALQTLFGRRYAERAKASGPSFRNPLQDMPNSSTAQEKSCLKTVATEPSNSPLATTAIRATRLATVSGRTKIFGKRAVPECAAFGSDRAQPQLLRTKPGPSIPPTGRAAVRFPTDSGREKHELRNIHLMKRRIRHISSSKQIAPPTTTPVLPPTHEEIRKRAHDIFIARGSSPGNDLDDWLRAERELKQQRAGTNKDTT